MSHVRLPCTVGPVLMLLFSLNQVTKIYYNKATTNGAPLEHAGLILRVHNLLRHQKHPNSEKLHEPIQDGCSAYQQSVEANQIYLLLKLLQLFQKTEITCWAKQSRMVWWGFIWK